MNKITYDATSLQSSAIYLYRSSSSTGDPDTVSQFEPTVVEVLVDRDYFPDVRSTVILYVSSPEDELPVDDTDQLATQEYLNQFRYKCHLLRVSENIYRINISEYFKETMKIGSDNNQSKIALQIIDSDGTVHNTLKSASDDDLFWCTSNNEDNNIFDIERLFYKFS